MRYLSAVVWLIAAGAIQPLSAQVRPDSVAAAYRNSLQGRRGYEPVAEEIRQHRYKDAEQLVELQLRENPNDHWALSHKARLLIQAWRLDEAEGIARSLVADNYLGGYLNLGRVLLLKKDYYGALAVAEATQLAFPKNADAHLLEADVHFWNQDPQAAEAPLRRALELDPDNADARFAYGYAIWRRGDPRALPAMAEQWNRALTIDPLHYVTHWHFGNGHTHLTYADYAQPTDSIVRARLRAGDTLVAVGKLREAIALTRAVESEYPASMLPALMRGSIYYMAYDLPRAERLDSAQAIFQTLLTRQGNYGPAHNGLAAVIKQRQFAYHVSYDSLEAAIAAEPVPSDSAFYRVFKDVRYYPGERVERMARQQLGPALAYIPFLDRLSYTYTVFPLHIDLAEAMRRPAFRTTTTFDNRQWMDIRGSGGNHASAGIEYVERGSHQERVVLLHEYVHQFHGAVLTDQQQRRIRKLYHDAVADNRTLDYYAANNESEFFAQSYEAYLSPVKVHPLNHKAMNTRSDLVRKDPALFAFLDTLITENRAYLAGDSAAMRSNWAQVYVTLARQARTSTSSDSVRWHKAQMLLDSALLYDSRYLPALIEQAALRRDQRRWSEALDVLSRAEQHAPDYAPTLSARAQLLAARNRAAGGRSNVDTLAQLYRRALQLETDVAERAQLNRTLRELLRDYARVAEAIEVAEQYVRAAPTSSTYLRDRRDEAAAFAAELRVELGHAAETLPFFRELVERKPQHYQHRAQAAQAYIAAGEPGQALRLIDEGERILSAGGEARAEYVMLRAAAYAALAGQGDVSAAHLDSTAALLRSMSPRQRARLNAEERLRLAQMLIGLDEGDDVEPLLVSDSTDSPRIRAEYLHARAFIDYNRNAEEAAIAGFRSALELNPHHVLARILLIETLRRAGRRAEAEKVLEQERELRPRLGPEFHRYVASILN